MHDLLGDSLLVLKVSFRRLKLELYNSLMSKMCLIDDFCRRRLQLGLFETQQREFFSKVCRYLL